MPAYNLSPRQERFFADTVNIHRRSKGASSSKRLLGTNFTTVPTATGVRCRIEPSSEASSPLPIGRSNHDIVVTTDNVRFHVDQEVDDGDYVQLLTPGHSEFGTWYVIQGGPEVMNFRAKTKKFLMRRDLAPPVE